MMFVFHCFGATLLMKTWLQLWWMVSWIKGPPFFRTSAVMELSHPGALPSFRLPMASLVSSRDSEFTNADSLMMTTSASGSVSGVIIEDWRINCRWDLWKVCSLPLSPKAAGIGWFSYSKNSWRSHSLLWDAVHSCEKRLQSAMSVFYVRDLVPRLGYCKSPTKELCSRVPDIKSGTREIGKLQKIAVVWTKSNPFLYKISWVLTCKLQVGNSGTRESLYKVGVGYCSYFCYFLVISWLHEFLTCDQNLFIIFFSV